MALAPGTRIGPYDVSALIGAGGMGEVYRARDTRLKRDVAIKVVRGAWVDTSDRLARFEREAELLAALNHPNIAAIYGVEESAGTTALVLELVDGPTLADRLVTGPLPLSDALTISRQIIDALDAAHEKGIVHRDLKPANIKVRPDGTVKVLDFGLAKTLESDAAPQGVTRSPTMTSPAVTSMGVVLGTAAYMSPEQARGQAVDKRSDIWAFGCVLYEMLTGRSVFARTTVADTMAAILEREPDWSAMPAAIPTSLRKLLRRCLDKNRTQRLRDIADARHALDDIDDDASRVASTSARTQWTRLLAGAAVVASIAAVVAVLATRGAPRAPATTSGPGPQFTRVTADAAFSTEPAISRDGTMVVYASGRDGMGQLDLWLQRTSGGQPIRLTNDAADDRQPDFSPDGSLIAFRSDRANDGVYVMPALGGDARLIAEGGRRPRFSPDGARIAFWTGPWLAGADALARGYSVFVVPANGGQPMRIADGFWTARDPVWAPDGQSLLFFGRKTGDDSLSGRFDWWWAPLDGREPVPTGAYPIMARHGVSAAIDAEPVAGVRQESLPATWTQAGVLFSAALGDSVSLWRLSVSSNTGQADETSLERLTSNAGLAQLPSADDTGRIAFQSSSEGYVSLTLPLDPNAGRVTGPIVRQTYWGSQATGRNSLDHAGRLLAYVRTGGGENEIWVKDLETGQERHLVTAPSVALNPVISPDGARVAYSVPDSTRVTGYVVPTSGGTAREICRCVLQGWFSDNRRILALDGPGGSRRVRAIHVVDGTEADLVTHPTNNVGRADISPDGRWLAFNSDRQTWIAPVRPGNPPGDHEWISIRKATTPDTAERPCGWSPDSRLLYLLLERDGFRDLYAQRIDQARGTPVGEPFIVQHLHDPTRRWGSTPFGNAIVSNAFVFTQVEMTGNIWLIDPSTPSR